MGIYVFQLSPPLLISSLYKLPKSKSSQKANVKKTHTHPQHTELRNWPTAASDESKKLEFFIEILRSAAEVNKVIVKDRLFVSTRKNCPTPTRNK